MRPKRGVGPAEWRPQHHSLGRAWRSWGTSLRTCWHTSQPCQAHLTASPRCWEPAFLAQIRSQGVGLLDVPPRKSNRTSQRPPEGVPWHRGWREQGAVAGGGGRFRPSTSFSVAVGTLPLGADLPVLRAGHGAKCPSSVPVLWFRGCLQATRLSCDHLPPASLPPAQVQEFEHVNGKYTNPQSSRPQMGSFSFRAAWGCWGTPPSTPPPAPQDPVQASGAGETGSFPSRGLCSPKLSAPSSQHPEPRAPPHHQGWSSGSRLPLPAPG